MNGKKVKNKNMQKIFIVRSDYDSDKVKVNDFIGSKGKIISVTPSHPSSSTSNDRGSWLVVADNLENILDN